MTEIDTVIHDAGRQPELHVVLLGPNAFTFNGVVDLGGRINLLVSESLSNERMWVKSVDLPSKRVTWHGASRWQSPLGPQATEIPLPAFHRHFDDPGFVATVGRELEGYYRTALDAAWAYLNPEEMALVKAQSQEIRRRKVY